MRHSIPRHCRRGFTLIELMIVVVIVGILAALAIPKFNKVARDSREAEAPPILKQLYTLQMRYKQQYDRYAPAIDSLEGGGASFQGTNYYDFELNSDPDAGTYLACAKPKAAYGYLRHFTIDDNRVITPREGGCT